MRTSDSSKSNQQVDAAAKLQYLRRRTSADCVFFIPSQKDRPCCSIICIAPSLQHYFMSVFTSSLACSPSTAIPKPRVKFVVSRCRLCDRRCAQKQTGTDSLWLPAPWPCSHSQP